VIVHRWDDELGLPLRVAVGFGSGLCFGVFFPSRVGFPLGSRLAWVFAGLFVVGMTDSVLVLVFILVSV
jgi:hypothetical protein